MTMIELIAWLQKEEFELEDMLYSRDNDMEEGEYQIKQGRLEEVRRILRKLQRNGMI